ncbi:hypothetical protein ACFO0A_13165 [Novosphingobium tardum]|uniref:Uncharacterized protein n=1 Tax=Novosphingobium tardum TaxID=1538021 RepID=A0ABV8RRS8_9SPHN
MFDKLFRRLGILALAVIAAAGLASWWMVNNEGALTAAVKDAGGARDAQCAAMRAEAQAYWDQAVERGTVEADSEMLDRVDRDIEAKCGAA